MASSQTTFLRFARVLLLSLLATVAAGAAGAVAQTDGSGVPAYSAGVNPDEYQPVDESQREETVSATLMVTLAYSLMWLAVVVFLVAMLRRSRTLREDVARARGQLDALDEQVKALMRRGGGD